MYTATTRSIAVSVTPLYLDEQSSPAEGRFVWAYRVIIENRGDAKVQLLSRYWRITDALGRVQEVRGPGVVGEQPVLKPGESFDYTSGCPLATPSGIMEGSYRMVGADGAEFDVGIPPFSLDSPHQERRLN